MWAMFSDEEYDGHYHWKAYNVSKGNIVVNENLVFIDGEEEKLNALSNC